MAYITKKRMSIIGLIVALICSSFIVSSSVIAEENRTEADAAKYIQVQVETMLYATAGQEPIGQLEAGAQFVKTGEDDDWVAIQWGDQDAYIAREAVTDIEEKEMDESIRFVAAEEIDWRAQPPGSIPRRERGAVEAGEYRARRSSPSLSPPESSPRHEVRRWLPAGYRIRGGRPKAPPGHASSLPQSYHGPRETDPDPPGVPVHPTKRSVQRDATAAAA